MPSINTGRSAKITTAWGKKIDKALKAYRRECLKQKQINDKLSTEDKFRKLMKISSGGKKSFNFLTTDNATTKEVNPYV